MNINKAKGALYGLFTDNFEDAVLSAVNLGGDADTIGAITGQIAGLYYGFDSIPNKFVDGLYNKELLDKYTSPFIEFLK